MGTFHASVNENTVLFSRQAKFGRHNVTKSECRHKNLINHDNRNMRIKQQI